MASNQSPNDSVDPPPCTHQPLPQGSPPCCPYNCPRGYYGMVLVHPFYQQGSLQLNILYAVISVLFCCPIGIFAVCKAMQANDHWARGDYGRSIRASMWAKKLAMLAISVGLMVWTISYLFSSHIMLLVYLLSTEHQPTFQRNYNGTE